jgi:hypothetical protein
MDDGCPEGCPVGIVVVGKKVFVGIADDGALDGLVGFDDGRLVGFVGVTDG